MTTLEGRQLAYFAYNHDDAYTAAVEESGQRYQTLIELPDDEYGTALTLGISEPDADDDPLREALASLSDLRNSILLDW